MRDCILLICFPVFNTKQYDAALLYCIRLKSQGFYAQFVVTHLHLFILFGKEDKKVDQNILFGRETELRKILV